MSVVSSRNAIKKALASKHTLLVLSGAADSATAESVHTEAEQVLEPWQRVVWIQDLTLLNADQKEQWLAMGGRYAVIARKSREPVKWGYSSEFLLGDGTPSSVLIAKALNAGDKQ